MISPRGKERGPGWRSTTVTRKPFRPSARARTSPPTPAPAIKRSRSFDLDGMLTPPTLLYRLSGRQAALPFPFIAICYNSGTPSSERLNQEYPTLNENQRQDPVDGERIFLPWEKIDSVLLDMDGTLLDKHFDDYFWEELLPERFAEKNRISLPEAKASLYAFYKAEERTLNWTDIHYW